MPKARKKPRKRGPKEERLVIQEDPQDALKRLLKPSKAATDSIKAEFDAAHVEGMQALKERDYRRLTRAIERERDIIEKARTRTSQRKKTT